MFFLDATGFFSLISLLIQCALAWIFAAFFGTLAAPGQAWLRRLRGAFLGLGIALTALGVRFTLAWQHPSGIRLLRDGEIETKLLCGAYLAGKVVYLWFLAAGLQMLAGRTTRLRPVWLAATIAPAFAIGCLLPTAELLLLLQVPFVVAVVLGCARSLLRSSELRFTHDGANAWRRVLIRVLVLTAVVWTSYGIAAVMVGPLVPVPMQPWSALLRLNSLIDLVLQVVLATSLIVLALHDAHGEVVRALRERDRLREQLQRDEKLRALSTLVSGVAHEINNPLTAILGFAEDLDDSDAAVRRKAAAVVLEQAERCRAIVQRMSLLGRRVSLVAAPIDLPALLRRVQRGFEPELARAGVQLVATTVSSTRPFVADPTGVEQVLTNLIGNALQASPRGSEITILVAEEPTALVVQVLDRGPGVPVAHRQQIFEPFWTTKQEGHGTGLGLAVVDAILRAHGGSVVVDDASGGGARFTVRWPWEPRALAAMPQSPEPASQSAPLVLPTTARRRLLVVDDEAVVRATIARQARSDGWEVTEAESAESALDLLGAPGADFEVIACDLRMPGMSGVSFHDALAQRDPRWLSRLLFVTGDLASDTAARFAARCKSPILGKPFAAEELLRQLRQVAQTA